MRVLLHIGSDKTGSTSIQRHLGLNHGWLRTRSIYYPAEAVAGNKSHARLLQRLDRTALKEIAAQLSIARDAGCAMAVLSWEGMCHYREQQLRSLLTVLEPYEVTILVYLREQADLLQSGHLQLIKSNNNRLRMRDLEHPRSLRARVSDGKMALGLTRNYYRMLSRWEKVFPRAAIVVRIYARPQLFNADVVEDFLAQLGVSPDKDFETIAGTQNPSIDVETALLVEAWQDQARPDAVIERRLDIAQSIAAIEGRGARYFLSRERVGEIRRGSRAGNIALARRFMGSEDDPFGDAPDCWRVAELSSLVGRSQQLEEKITALDAARPTLRGAVAGDQLAGLLDTAQGWAQAAPWGVWSLGAVSHIRCRVFHRWLREGAPAVRVVLRGRYYADNETTSVRINGIDFGELQLDRAVSNIIVPLDALGAHEALDITLGHSQPVSPRAFEGRDDDRPIALGLLKMACMRA